MCTAFLQEGFSDIQSLMRTGAQQAKSLINVVLFRCASVPRVVLGGPLTQWSLSITSILSPGDRDSSARR